MDIKAIAEKAVALHGRANDCPEVRVYEACQDLGVKRVPWRGLAPYLKGKDDKGKGLYDFSDLIGSKSPKVEAPKTGLVEPPKTGFNLADAFADTTETEDVVVVAQPPASKPMRAKSDSDIDEERERKARAREEAREARDEARLDKGSTDPKLLDKYVDEVSEADTARATTTFKGLAERAYLVMDYEARYVIGVTKSFDKAWDVLKMRLFHDFGEYTDKEGARSYIKKKGWVLLKARQSSLRVLILQIEIE